MAITQEMIERFKAEYPTARSATEAARAAGWPAVEMKTAPLAVAVALGLAPKGNSRGKQRDVVAPAFEAHVRQFPGDDTQLMRLCSALAMRLRLAAKRAKAEGR